MNLFQTGVFRLNSGYTSPLKIECDALAACDWATLAHLVHSRFDFRDVVGIPTGGLMFQEALKQYAAGGDEYPLLLVDDVLTTGGSMERMREKLIAPDIIGVVVFARTPPADWIHPIFQMWP